MRGKFITLEGPEKSGKSTQIRLLSLALKKRGFKTLFVREPGSTEIGEKIRKILLDKKNNEMSALTEMMLYMSARAQLVDQVIRPALEKGTIVLCDRFLDSTLAYQGFGCGLDVALIKKVGHIAIGDVVPDLTLLLDFWKSSEYLRNHKTPDRIEMRSCVFHQKVKKGYFALARREPQRIKIIRVQKDIEKTQEAIQEVVLKCLFKKSSAKKPHLRS